MDLFTFEVIGCGILVFAAVVLSLTHSHKHHKNSGEKSHHLGYHFRKYLKRK